MFQTFLAFLRRGHIELLGPQPHPGFPRRQLICQERRAFNRGALIYTNPKLHAKVVISGSQLVVGSANITANSRGLREAAVVTREVSTVHAARDWFYRILQESTRIGARRLNELESIPIARPGGRRTARPTLLEAFEEDLPLLDDFLFAGFTYGPTLKTSQVKRGALKRKILVPTQRSSEWTWYELKDSRGADQRLRKAYRDKPCICFEAILDTNDRLSKLKGLEPQAERYLGSWRERSHDGQLRVMVCLEQRAFGVRLSGRKWPGRLCRILSAGLRRSPGLRKRISNRDTFYIHPDELRDLFALGRASF